jgi:hypothetical protein
MPDAEQNIHTFTKLDLPLITEIIPGGFHFVFRSHDKLYGLARDVDKIPGVNNGEINYVSAIQKLHGVDVRQYVDKEMKVVCSGYSMLIYYVPKEKPSLGAKIRAITRFYDITLIGIH